MPRRSTRRRPTKANPAPYGPVYRYLRSGASDTMGAATSAASSGGSINLNNAQLLTVTTATGAGVTYAGLGLAFRLSDLAGYTEFTALYDQYRVKKLTYTLVPMWSTCVSPEANPNGTLGGFIHSCYDYDDANYPAVSTSGITTLMERPSYSCVAAVKTSPTIWEVVPRIAMAAYAASAFSSYANLPAEWIDCSSPNVEHYGLKLLFELNNPASASVFMNYRLFVTAEVEFRQSR